jgi:outer membrane protein assembly factor BamB
MKKLAPLVLVAWLIVQVGTAMASPPATGQDTFMVDGPVHAIAQVGGIVWLAGRFVNVLDQNGNVSAPVDNVAAFDVASGLPSSVDPPNATGTGAIIYDLSVSGTTVYMAGTFTAVNGQTRQNLAAFDGATGALLPFQPAAGKLRSVLATGGRVYAGGSKLKSYRLDGTRDPAFAIVVPDVDPSLRGHTLAPSFRDLAWSGTDLVGACACDTVNGTPTKALVRIDATTGALQNWTPNVSPNVDSAAFGEAVIVESGTVYLGAGGSDFTAAFDLAAGTRRWREDTSGSSQALASFGGQLVVGGHFQWVQFGSSGQCGSNASPNTSCWNQPRLFAVDKATGAPDQGWTPGICCKYRGVWAVLPDSSGGLVVGGEFTKLNGTLQKFYGRLI